MSNLLPRPVFVIGGARSGTTLLFELLSRSPDLWSAYAEQHGPYEWDIGLHPDLSRGESNALDASHATAARIVAMRAGLRRRLANGELFGFPSDRLPGCARWLRAATRVAHRLMPLQVRMVDKNPKHCFRIPFLRAAFPDAVFILLSRGPRATIHSLLEGWRSSHFTTYDVSHVAPQLGHWKFDLPTGWTNWANLPLEQLCAHQWVGYYDAITTASRDLPPGTFITCRYEELIERPVEEMARLFAFLGLPMRGAAERLALSPPVINALSMPCADKWRPMAATLDTLAPIFDSMRQCLGYDDNDRPTGQQWPL